MKCIIIEGPQGSGKTTLANYLRENIPSCNLYRLGGNKDKTISGKMKSKKMYIELMKYIKNISNTEINIIFDRTFFTEYVYCNLGYKDYKFDDVYKSLLNMLSKLDYEIIYISLYLKNHENYIKRIGRQHHNYQSYSIESSILQEKEYKKLIPELKKLSNVTVYEIPMDDFKSSYKKIDKIFGICKR